MIYCEHQSQGLVSDIKPICYWASEIGQWPTVLGSRYVKDPRFKSYPFWASAMRMSFSHNC